VELEGIHHEVQVLVMMKTQGAMLLKVIAKGNGDMK
jgi:hypothetical protein